MDLCFFVSDLHGHVDRYEKLFLAVAAERPAAVFFGGDLLGGGWSAGYTPGGADRNGERSEGELPEPEVSGFITGFLAAGLRRLRGTLGERYPKVFLIPGNDDGRWCEEELLSGEADGLWYSMHGRKSLLGRHPVYGYACVPPTPFLLKDWERYDVSRHVDPGACSPEEGYRSVDVPADELRYRTIQKDLEDLTGEEDMSAAIFLFHAPPYDTPLDRAALDGVQFEHVPLDVHVGSIAVRRFLEARGPLVSLHGHVHEAARLTGTYRTRVGRTHAFTAAHDGPELALVRFAPENPDGATRELL